MPLDFLAGAITMGYLVCSLFFLRFWRRTGDGLFAAFAVAFVLLAANQALSTLMDVGRESGWIWLLRVAAFLAIIVAIAGKNIRPRY